MHDPRSIQVRIQIEQLLREYPELAEDDLPLALESETDAIDYLRKLEHIRQGAAVLVKAADFAIEDMTSRKKRFERRDEAMRKLMLQVLQTANLRKLELPEATLSIRAGSPRVIIVHEEAIPEAFIRIKREPNKESIKVALQDGIDVPGATLSNAEENLTIRTK